ncbi:hypothetical protein KA005_08400 [bacterium]|nr:hypothetical protein [bacterium]
MAKMYMANISSLNGSGSTELEFSFGHIQDPDKSWVLCEDVEEEVKE